MSRRQSSGLGGAQGDKNAWMVTFSDLLMLMLTFFVLLLSMSSLDQREIEQAMRPGLKIDDTQASGPRQDEYTVLGVPETVLVEISEDLRAAMEGDDRAEVRELFEQLFLATHLEGRAWLERRPEGLVISIDGRVAFAANETRLLPPAQRFLDQFASLVTDLSPNVVAQTYFSAGDGVAAQDAAWELALQRADRVANYLMGQAVQPDQLRIMGYGYPAGRDEMAFLRQSDLLRLVILTGTPTADAWL